MSRLFCTSGIADEYDERSSSLASPKGRVDCIDLISKKISNLSSELDGFHPDSQLVIDRYLDRQQTFDVNDEEQFGCGNLKTDNKVPKQIAKRDSVSTKEKQRKDVNKFAGAYSLQAVMEKHQDLQDVSSSKTCRQKKRNLKENKNSQSTVAKKPMLVELHTFPGFNPDELTPLPSSLTTRNVLDIVTSAQKDLNKKPGFKKEFKRIFFAHVSVAVVQDLFWWFFLEKYQACPEVQRRMFSRVACNYVKLVFTSWDPKYREAFFKRFPSLVCQAVYTIFCHAFPTSYRQFDDRFKQDLTDVAYQWIVGTKPARRCWERWPLTHLEPNGLNNMEESKKRSSKGSVFGWFGSEAEENLGLSKNARSWETMNSNYLKSEGRQSLPQIIESGVMDAEIGATAVVDDREVTKKKDSGGWVRFTHEKPERVKEDALKQRQHQPLNLKRKLSTPLPSNKTNNSSLQRNVKVRESCHAGKGPEFHKVAFDVYGHSPLVKHFLQNKRLSKESGTSILVQRTEIDKLPPIDAPTYQDIIKESMRLSHELEKQIQSLKEQSSNERIVFARQQKKEREEFRKKETDVLSRQKDVKKISDLILLQLAKGRSTEYDKLISTSIANTLKFEENDSK